MWDVFERRNMNKRKPAWGEGAGHTKPLLEDRSRKSQSVWLWNGGIYRERESERERERERVRRMGKRFLIL